MRCEFLLFEQAALLIRAGVVDLLPEIPYVAKTDLVANPPTTRSPRDSDLLMALEPNSFFCLSRQRSQVYPFVSDVWLTDDSLTFYPALLADLKQRHQAAYDAVIAVDEFKFLAKVSIVPAEGWLPMSGGGPMLLPMWSHHLSGSALVIAVRAEQSEQIKLETAKLAVAYSLMRRSLGGDIIPTYDQVALIMQPADEVGKRLDAVRKLLLHSGVSWTRDTAAQCSNDLEPGAFF